MPKVIKKAVEISFSTAFFDAIFQNDTSLDTRHCVTTSKILLITRQNE